MNKQEIQNKIEELKKQMTELEEELNKPEGKVFKPKIDDIYYTVDACGKVVSFTWNNDSIDLLCYVIGNCFQTREEAEFEVERLKVIAKLKRFAEKHNEPIKWNDRQYKYYIGFDAEIQSIDYYCTFTIKCNDIYFSSKEIARQAVATIGEERIKKYYLQVE